MRKDALKTFSIIKQYIDPGATLAGDNAWILCPHPDHFDRRRSNCSINLTRQVWNCFACGESGSLRKALKFFDMPGVTLPELSPLAYHEPEEIILDPAILGAYAYYADPWIDLGFSEALLDEHCIGYDIHNKRITIPMYTKDGELIAISGRATLEGQEPRYKIYKKELGKCYPYGYSPKTHSHLWRFDKCNHMDGPILIVEGFKAALWAVMAGYKKTVALCGASMTSSQAQLLIDHNKPVVLMLDNDEAGRKGTQSSGIRLSSAGLAISVVDYDFPAPDDIPLSYFHTLVEHHGLTRSLFNDKLDEK
jgi:DNA primase